MSLTSRVFCTSHAIIWITGRVIKFCAIDMGTRFVAAESAVCTRVHLPRGVHKYMQRCELQLPAMLKFIVRIVNI